MPGSPSYSTASGVRIHPNTLYFNSSLHLAWGHFVSILPRKIHCSYPRCNLPGDPDLGQSFQRHPTPALYPSPNYRLPRASHGNCRKTAGPSSNSIQISPMLCRLEALVAARTVSLHRGTIVCSILWRLTMIILFVSPASLTCATMSTRKSRVDC